MHPTAEQILQTAPTIFAESGFAGASTRRLAQAAGVNLATLAYHFGDKQGLYEAAIDHVYGALLSTPVPALDQDQPIARLEALLRAIYEAAQSHRDGIRLLLRHVIAEGRLPETVTERWTPQVLERVELLLSKLGLGQVDPLVLLSLNHLVARYAVSDPDDIAPFTKTEDPHSAVVQHLTRLAASELGLS
jgi:AcrR family transcriptional regulator